MNGDNEYYISIDIESDGPIPGANSMLQLGAAAFDGRNEQPYKTFEANLMLLPEAAPDPGTMKWWREQKGAYEKTRLGARRPEEVMRNFVHFVEMTTSQISGFRNKGKTIKPVVIGYPVTFDFMFVYWYVRKFVGDCPFGFQGLDIKTLAAAMLDLDYREASKRNFPGAWMNDLPPHTHNALDDAIEQGIIFTRMLKTLRDESPGSMTRLHPHTFS